MVPGALALRMQRLAACNTAEGNLQSANKETKITPINFC